MRGIAEDLGQFDSELTLIGTGTPEQGAGFRERSQTGFRLLVDPQLVGYRAFELGQRLYGGFRPQTPLRLLRARLRGFRGGRIEGNPHQLGGVFIITPSNELAFSYYSRTLDDRVQPAVIADAVRRLVRG